MQPTFPGSLMMVCPGGSRATDHSTVHITHTLQRLQYHVQSIRTGTDKAQRTEDGAHWYTACSTVCLVT